jgi:pimeloyl-ACP methyl ester carboxylesterase
MQTHHLPVRISFGEQSEALWALKPTGRAILFVHGFGGSATTTWVQFPTLLQKENSCRGYDLVFYGYDGLRTRARPNGDLLARFLDAMFSNPAGLLAQSLPSGSRPKTFRYKQIIIVAHSLGAVVSRIALVDAYGKRRDWASKVKLVFFAPAHGGANILSLASLAMGVLRMVPVEAFARYQFQVLHDLEENCQTLAQLAAQTRKAIEGGARNLIAERIIYAGQDKVVNPATFCEDPVPDFIHGASHTGVCKPRNDFSDPLQYVLASL